VLTEGVVAVGLDVLDGFFRIFVTFERFTGAKFAFFFVGGSSSPIKDSVKSEILSISENKASFSFSLSSALISLLFNEKFFISSIFL